MKICIVNINEESVSGPYTELLTKNFNKVKRDDTELGWKYVKRLKRASDTVMSYFIQLNRTDIIECMYEAYKEGYDGIMIASSGDPGVYEASEIVDIPVVGPMESSIMTACTFGSKFGILTVEDRRWAEYCESMAVRYGVHNRLAGVERITIPSSEAFTKGFLDLEWMGKELIATSKRLIDRGANAIVIGSAGLSTIASAAGICKVPDLDVPIFDCLSVGLKMAELRVDLQKKLGMPPVSRVGSHELLPEKDIVRVRKLFGHA
jgi:allantoin racemase